MKTTRSLIAGMLVVGGVLALATPTFADSRGRRRDMRELEAGRRELRWDWQRGASRAEIARDRTAIARERRDVWGNDYRSWDRWRRDNDRYQNRWNHWGHWDRG